MAYTINRTNGTILAVVADGTVNTTSTSLTLVGKNYAGYGEFLDENFVHLLENSANSTAPSPAMTGQLWWDSTNGLMKVYNGTTWKTISASTASATAPGSSVTGDLWFDTNNNQLNVYNGATWILVGPASGGPTGTSGIIPQVISDGTSTHVVDWVYVFGNIVAAFSKDATFSPSPSVGGFGLISPGLNLSTTIANGTAKLSGTANNATYLQGYGPTDFMSAVANATTTGYLTTTSDGGLTVGSAGQARLTTSGTTVNMLNQSINGNLVFQVSPSGVATSAIVINGSTAAVGVKGITNLNSNGVGNIGSSSSYFNTVFATATTALYADVAERFAADEALAPGTVVELGGQAEVTRSTQELSDNVFGVVSTRAAYLMNSGAGTDDTHPPIAMTGRVPVRVLGTVKKGDRLVSAGAGLARSAAPGEATPFNVIGRALADKMSAEEGMVEAIVTIK